MHREHAGQQVGGQASGHSRESIQPTRREANEDDIMTWDATVPACAYLAFTNPSEAVADRGISRRTRHGSRELTIR